MRKFVWLIVMAVFVAPSGLSASEKDVPQTITVRIVAAQPEASPEGFVEDTGAWRMDSAKDVKKSIDKKCWIPNGKVKKASPELKTVCFRVVEGDEDVTVTIAARGENATTLGQRTTMSFYKGVAIADSVPTVGVTRWVSIILGKGTYQKEFVAWSTNTARWSLGAWSQNADLLAGQVMDWCLLNQAKFRD